MPRWRASWLVRDDSNGWSGFYESNSDRLEDMKAWSRGETRPSGASNTSLAIMQRAQGMPGEGLTHGPPAEKMQAAGTTGKAEHAGIPCAMVFTLIRSLPGAPACWPPCRDKACALRCRHQLRGVRTLRLHVRDRSFVRAFVRRRCDPSRPPHPRLACRDDRALRPCCMRRDARKIIMIYGNTQEDYFFRKLYCRRWRVERARRALPVPRAPLSSRP